jgi:hypothetical protein
MKLRPVAAELFHADGQTGVTNLVVFHNVTNAPKILQMIQEFKWVDRHAVWIS